MINQTVDPDDVGADYATLSLWEAQNRDLTATGDNDDLTVTCTTSGSADGSVCGIAGWTLDSTHRIYIVGGTAHNGVWTTSAYHMDLSSSAYCLAVIEWCYVTGIQANNSHNTGRCFYAASGVAGGIIQFDKCIAKSDSAQRNGVGFYYTGSNVYPRIKNCLVYDLTGTSGIGVRLQGTGYVHHNTVVDCYTGYSIAGGTHVIKNCIAQGATDGYAGSWGTEDYNISNVASDLTGTHSYNSATVTFNNSGADDFTLSTSDTTAKDLGVDLSGDSNLAVADDVKGTSRPQGSTSDIGFHELPAAAGTRRIFVIS